MVSNESLMASVRTSQYRALIPGKGEIRLLRLEGFDTGDLNPEANAQAMVTCSLQYACLDNHPRYTALSYAWGDPTIRKDIMMDGQRIQVTMNLELALRHLLDEQQSLGSRPRSLWVDAVCIDQQNEAERSHQVSQMGRIFRTAEETIIWLGAASRDSDLAIESLTKLSVSSDAILASGIRSWSEFPFDGAESYPMIRVVLAELTDVLADLKENDSAKLTAITSLYERPWFRRVWVVQERVLSGNCVAYCGQARIPWLKFYGGFWLLCGLRDYLNLASTDLENSSTLATALTAALDRVVPVAFTSYGLPLLQLLVLLSGVARRAGLQASDPRDYIYGLLGLTHAHSSPSIRVDYSKSWNAVRTQVGQACLAHYGPYMLSFAGRCSTKESHGPEVQEVPSWAPDWSSIYLVQPLYVPSLFLVRDGNSGCPYSAARHSTQNLSQGFTADGRLNLSALYVDTVGHWGQPFAADNDPADDVGRVSSLSSWLHDLEAILPSVNEVYRTTEEVATALWKTPIADRAYLHAWETARASDKTCRSYKAVRAGNVAGGVKYTNIAYNKLFGRRPLRTATGYIGLGPLETRVGDTIWIVPGAGVPFVLRPAGNGRFLVIGEVYVHGVMNGEFFESEEDLQHIVLV